MFSFEHVKNSFSVVFKRRPDGSRHLIAMLVLLFGLHSLSCSYQSVKTQYIKVVYPWGDDTTLNTFVATLGSVETALGAIALGIFLPLFSQVLKLNDMVITLICFVSFLGGLNTILLARVPWVLYIASAVQMFYQMTTTPIRSALTKIVDKNETGKVFHTWTEMRLKPSWVYLGSKGTRRSHSSRESKWASTWYVSRLAPRSL